MKKHAPLILICIVILLFFSPVLFSKSPAPFDTIIGLYHPFRDLFAKNYPNGIPFKNFLLTDPVRQLIPWKFLSISLLGMGQLPLWNSFNGAGMPLLANFQSGVFYPFNVVFLFPSFLAAWTAFIAIQPLLAAVFFYLYLRNLKLEKWASVLGAFVFAFCGFSIVWMEWGNVLHTALWLPLILLAEDKLLEKKSTGWVFVLILAGCSQIFAGHLQIWFYSFLVSNAYLLYRILQKTKGNIQPVIKEYVPFLLIGIAVFTIGSVQLLPTIHYIGLSARNVDQAVWQQPGWFIPWQNLAQFIAPDFFGNPATLNYWGVWNYAELVGYIGILPLIFVLSGIFFSKNKEKFFFIFLVIVSFIFALPTFVAKIPFQLNVPFISTSQPTRLLFVVDFSFAVLTAIGLDSFLKRKDKQIFIAVGSVFVLLGILFGITYFSHDPNLIIARHNLYIPLALTVVSLFSITFAYFFKKNETIIALIFMAIVVFDLFRFGSKFLPFSPQSYFFPQTQVTNFLEKNAGDYRVMATDSRIFPPNFSIMYGIQSVDLYDPLYLRNYAELIAASERNKPDIMPPFGFNRIITPHRFFSKIINLLGVKYVLTFDQLQIPGYRKVTQEGQIMVYENQNVLPRTFFVGHVVGSTGKQEAIDAMFSVNLENTAVIESQMGKSYSLGLAKIINYSPNKVTIATQNKGEGFLVLTDTFYDTWDALIDGRKTSIIPTDYALRGIVVPPGSHTVEFIDRLF